MTDCMNGIESGKVVLYKSLFSNIFVFQTSQHFHRSKLIISGIIRFRQVICQFSFGQCPGIVIPLLYMQSDLLLSLPARILDKTALTSFVLKNPFM